MTPRAVIFGCSGPTLTAEERRFLAAADPWGFILFGRNVETPDQIRALTTDLREAVGRDAPILIDQEGGRVARMRAPAWREWLPALDQCLAEPEPARSMYLRYRMIAHELRAVGIDVNCAPVLDLARPDTHAIIRNRCYGDTPTTVAAIGCAVACGLLDGGVLPVMKHIPGHGRANLDTHLALPEVTATRSELAADFSPFAALADLPMAMTAHIVFTGIDPTAPATLSPEVIGVIRDDIGFDGLLMTDDLSMKALTGSFADRAARALAAGCDIVLHCNGDRDEMAAVLEAVPRLAGRARTRSDAALAQRRAPPPVDTAALAAEFDAIRASVDA